MARDPLDPHFSFSNIICLFKRSSERVSWSVEKAPLDGCFRDYATQGPMFVFIERERESE